MFFVAAAAVVVFLFSPHDVHCADMKQINRWHWRSRTSRDIALKMTTTNMLTTHDITLSRGILTRTLALSQQRAWNSWADHKQITNHCLVFLPIYFGVTCFCAYKWLFVAIGGERKKIGSTPIKSSLLAHWPIGSQNEFWSFIKLVTEPRPK